MNAQLQPPPFVPGIRPRIPFEVYQGMAGMNITLLKEMRRSAQHFQHRRHHPKESAPMTLGKAGHCAVLEPMRFGSDFAVWERRTSAGAMAPRNGQHWQEFEAQHAGQTIITANEYDTVVALQSAVRNDRDAMRYLLHGEPEVSMQAVLFGRQCKGRLDWLTRDWIDLEGVRQTGPCLVGVKMTRDCSEFRFGRQAASLGYALQWAFYLDLYKAITGEFPKVVEIAVENEAPYAVAVYEIPDEVLQKGCDEYMALLEQLAECERAQRWPGPVQGERILTMPQWFYGEEEITYVDE